MKLFRFTQNCKKFPISNMGLRRSISRIVSEESADLPLWFKPSKDDADNDDFIIPSKLDAFSSLKSYSNDQEQQRPTSPLTASEILKRFSNDWASAYAFFKWVLDKPPHQLSPELFDLMVDILGKSKQFDEMWRLIDEMGDRKLVSLSTLSKVMRRLAGSGRWAEAVEIFHKMEEFGVKKDTLALNSLLDTLCKERSVMRARDVFFAVRENIPPDAKTFNILIHGWCKARKIEEALWTIRIMRDSGFVPCVVSYTPLIEAHCLDKNFKAAEEILREMKASGCSPNVVTYTILMHSLGKAKETGEAMRVFEEMKREGCLPDPSFYNSLIYILCQGGLLKDALSVYHDMKGRGCPPDVNTYNTLISAACASSQEVMALTLLLKMGDDSCMPGVKTYIPVLKQCCKKKMMKLLGFLLDDMDRRGFGCDQETYTMLVQRLCNCGKLRKACSVLERMLFRGFIPRERTRMMLLEALQRKEMMVERETVVKLIAEAEKRKSDYCEGMPQFLRE
ncbi:uncharacterized protein LOC144707612 [Wolffia australiana]